MTICPSTDQALQVRLQRVGALARTWPGMSLTGYTRDGEFPAFVEHGRGPQVWDVDGNR